MKLSSPAGTGFFQKKKNNNNSLFIKFTAFTALLLLYNVIQPYVSLKWNQPSHGNMFFSSPCCPVGIFLEINLYPLSWRCFVTASFRKYTLPFKRELVHGVDEGSAQIFFPSSSLFTYHGDICITFCVASVVLWWLGGPAQWRVWQAKCEIKPQMRPCSLTLVVEADGDRERGGRGSCDCHKRYLEHKRSKHLWISFPETIYYTRFHHTLPQTMVWAYESSNNWED